MAGMSMAGFSRDGDGWPRPPVVGDAAALIPCLPGAHRERPTNVDERSRRLSHEELAVATLLAGEGHLVRSLPERPGSGPVADLEVCGTPVEVKSFLSLPDRAGRIPSARSVCNKLLGARAQAPTAVLYTKRSGLGEEAARAGVAEFAAKGQPGRISGVRVVGDGFDLTWSPRRLRQLGAASASGPARYQHPARRISPRAVEGRGVDGGLGR
jgi:hypothetical protein